MLDVMTADCRAAESQPQDFDRMPRAERAIGSRWSPQRARDWHVGLPWLVGCNFTPSYAINQLEFWQEDTFDLTTIDRELGWAADLGMNAVRVYLHDLLWHADRQAFIDRVEAFLAVADRHGIRTMLVLFDSCWDPDPVLGPQPQPRPGVHNSGWVQSPGTRALLDAREHRRLQDYVVAFVTAFANDPRVLAWDIWNEPDNDAQVDLCDGNALAAKAALVAPLLEKAFAWARACDPAQPLTSGIWLGNWSDHARLTAIQQIQTDNSDVITFHSYTKAAEFRKRIGWLKRYGRPIMCTEYMARATGSTFETILPIAKKEMVGTFCWGLVLGRTQTQLPWKPVSPRHRSANRWFHDVLHPDGRPHRLHETLFLRNITGRSAAR
jgi:hypothetical protein